MIMEKSSERQKGENLSSNKFPHTNLLSGGIIIGPFFFSYIKKGKKKGQEYTIEKEKRTGIRY
jgi:hypothetical protein